MDFSIKDGTGKGTKVKVLSDNRLSTKAVTITEQQLQSANGNSYQVGSGIVNLTSANESAVLFIKNNGDEPIGFSAVNITSTGFTGSTEKVMLAKVYLEGTTLSSSTATAALNNNFGSSKSLDATILKGAEGSSVTNGVVSGAFYIPVETFFNTDTAWVLPKGASLALTIEPATGNTSFDVTVTLEAIVFGEI